MYNIYNKGYQVLCMEGEVMSNSIKRITTFVQYILKNKIEKGNTVVDATMGNGNDTLFLSQLVGNTGKIFSFDIQHIALENTQKQLIDHKLNSYDIMLINDSHENLKKHIMEPIDAAMFNLGYLPKGDHSIITNPDSTIKGILSALSLLKKGGIISIVIYYGHDGGEAEKKQVLDFLNALSCEEVTIMQCDYINHNNNPPIVVFIEKNK